MICHKSIQHWAMVICCLLLPEMVNAQINTLTSKEKKDGWELLFNGKNLNGWHSYLEKKPGKAWKVQDGNIILAKNDKSEYPDYADLVSNKEYGDFDLKVEWKIEPCSNSGLMFYVHESPEYKQTYETGPEMQIVDLACSPDSKIFKHRAGDIYDLVPVDTERVSKGGEWNHYEVISKKGNLKLFQNGHKVIDIQLWDDHWREIIEHSKFGNMPKFGTFQKGHISFQGTENGKLWLQNIKIKKL